LCAANSRTFQNSLNIIRVKLFLHSYTTLFTTVLIEIIKNNNISYVLSNTVSANPFLIEYIDRTIISFFDVESHIFVTVATRTRLGKFQ